MQNKRCMLVKIESKLLKCDKIFNYAVVDCWNKIKETFKPQHVGGFRPHGYVLEKHVCCVKCFEIVVLMSWEEKAIDQVWARREFPAGRITDSQPTWRGERQSGTDLNNYSGENRPCLSGASLRTRLWRNKSTRNSSIFFAVHYILLFII